MKFLIDYHVRSDSDGEWIAAANIARVSRHVENVGFHGLGFTDHPAPSAKWLDGGGHETLDPFAALGFCAGVTDRLKLLTHLLVVPYRNPLLQASAMASLDLLSAGRTIFVLGTGYLRSEFAALGVDFESRNDAFDEAVAVIKEFSLGNEFTHEGRGFRALGQRMAPLPVQRPHPPLWLGGNSARARDRVAKWGQGWSVLMGSPQLAATSRTSAISTLDELATAIADIERRASGYGRAMSEISIQAASPLVSLSGEASVEEQLDQIGQLAEIGVSYVHVPMGSWGLDETLDRLSEFGASVIAGSDDAAG